MYAAIRQGKAKSGNAEELTRTIKEEAIPIISDVPGFKAYYVIYAPSDTVTAISIFDDYAGAADPTDERWRGSRTAWPLYLPDQPRRSPGRSLFTHWLSEPPPTAPGLSTRSGDPTASAAPYTPA